MASVGSSNSNFTGPGLPRLTCRHRPMQVCLQIGRRMSPISSGHSPSLSVISMEREATKSLLRVPGSLRRVSREIGGVIGYLDGRRRGTAGRGASLSTLFNRKWGIALHASWHGRCVPLMFHPMMEA